jgi:hypothetical protein
MAHVLYPKEDLAMSFKEEIAVGDRFTKVSSFRMPVWKVAHIRHSASEPSHARLEKEGTVGDSITVSLPALAGSGLYRRVPAQG